MNHRKRKASGHYPQRGAKTFFGMKDTRKRIDADTYISLLHAHAMGEISLSVTRLRAIETLLRKVLPDLQTIEHTGIDGGPVVTKIERVIVQPRGVVTVAEAIENKLIDQQGTETEPPNADHFFH